MLQYRLQWMESFSCRPSPKKGFIQTGTALEETSLFRLLCFYSQRGAAESWTHLLQNGVKSCFFFSSDRETMCASSLITNTTCITYIMILFLNVLLTLVQLIGYCLAARRLFSKLPLKCHFAQLTLHISRFFLINDRCLQALARCSFQNNENHLWTSAHVCSADRTRDADAGVKRDTTHINNR